MEPMHISEVIEKINSLNMFLFCVDKQGELSTKKFVYTCMDKLYKVKAMKEYHPYDLDDEVDLELRIDAYFRLLSSTVLDIEDFCMDMMRVDRRTQLLLAQKGELSSRLN